MPAAPPTVLLWLRRDLRRSDHPALGAAAAAGRVVVCHVLDPAEDATAGPTRRAWRAASLLAVADSGVDAAGEGRLCLRRGDPATVIPALASEVGAVAVHVSTETEPAGAIRDAGVRGRLADAGVGWVETGSPYAVTPGRLRTGAGTGYRVYGAFRRAWADHGWPGPAPDARATFLSAPSDPGAWAGLRADAAASPVPLPPAGEAAALDRWADFLAHDLSGYAERRDRPDLAATSALSPYLAVGAIHPRTLLADLARRPGPDADAFTAELAWREFQADVLHHHPGSVTSDLHPLGMPHDAPGPSWEAWRTGHTGYPIVDAGQRQLLATGWMHNRVRMITASFLTKDLHLPWQRGAAHFWEHLLDGDLASNTHNWQWVAGTGTDAAPYFRIFNPITQGERFDPDGAYVRRWVPELAHVGGRAVHQPWRVPGGLDAGYPERIIDHATERAESLARYHLARSSR